MQTTDTSNWQAKWIWRSGAEDDKNSYAYFRRTFELDAVPGTAPVRVTADSRYQLYVNGICAERGPARSEPAFQAYDELDIAPLLKPGGNVLAALVHHIGESTSFYVPGKPGFLLDVVAGVSDASLGTDAQWKAITAADFAREPSRRINGALEFNEVRDARLTPLDWTEPEFDDSAWPCAVVVGEVGCEPWTSLVARETPPQRRTLVPAAGYRYVGVWQEKSGTVTTSDVRAIVGHRRRWPLPLDRDTAISKPDGRGVPPRSIDLDTKPLPADGLKIAPGQFAVIDIGQIAAGHITLEVTAQAGQALDVVHGEYCDGYGGPRICEYSDRYIARDGRQRWEMFEKRGFRFLTIDVRGGSEPVTIHFAGVLFSSYPIKWREFACSDARLNEIWRLSAYTTQLTMEDAYTDCQSRERGQWWGDARVETLENYYCFGDFDLARRGILQMFRSQEPDGKVRAFVPTRADCYIPTWSLCWPTSVRDYHLFSGDTDLLRQLFPAIRKSVEYYDQWLKDGLLGNTGQWNFIDWTPVEVGDVNAALNAFYYGALVAVSEIAEAIGDAAGKAEYDRRAAECKASFDRAFWSDEFGAYVDCLKDGGRQSVAVGQPANCLAIHFGVADEARIDTILATVFDPDKVMLPYHWTQLGTINYDELRGVVMPSGSPYMSFYVVDALRKAGRHDQALDYIRDKWGIMLEEGDTATREMWQQQTGCSSSRAHGWSAAPAYDFPSYVLGVQPLEPGWTKIVIEPHLSGLAWAKGTIPMLDKELQVSVSDADGRLMVEGRLPDGFEATLRLPGKPDQIVAGRFSITS